MAYQPSSKNLKRFNRDFIDLLNKAKKAGFTFGTEYLDCEEEVIRTKDLDKKVDIADKWHWEARESLKGFGEAHQGLKQTMESLYEYPVGDIDLQPTISNFAKQMIE